MEEIYKSSSSAGYTFKSEAIPFAWNVNTQIATIYSSIKQVIDSQDISTVQIEPCISELVTSIEKLKLQVNKVQIPEEENSLISQTIFQTPFTSISNSDFLIKNIEEPYMPNLVIDQKLDKVMQTCEE